MAPAFIKKHYLFPGSVFLFRKDIKGMKKIKRDLNDIKTIPYNDTFSLKDFCENYAKTLDEKIYDIQTCDDQSIQIVFLERHLPHIIGLHHYQDKKHPNKLLRGIHNLSGQNGFDNMIEEAISFRDLQTSRNKSIWNNKKNKKRVLSMHLIPDIIRTSKLYLVDGNLKGKLNATHILESTLTNTCYSLCIEEDLKLNRFGTNYCCISNLIDDSIVKKKIEDGTLKEIKIKRILKKD